MNKLQERLYRKRYIKQLKAYGLQPREWRGKSTEEIKDYLRKQIAKDKRWLG